MTGIVPVSGGFTTMPLPMFGGGLMTPSLFSSLSLSVPLEPVEPVVDGS